MQNHPENLTNPTVRYFDAVVVAVVLACLVGGLSAWRLQEEEAARRQQLLDGMTLLIEHESGMDIETLREQLEPFVGKRASLGLTRDNSHSGATASSLTWSYDQNADVHTLQLTPRLTPRSQLNQSDTTWELRVYWSDRHSMTGRAAFLQQVLAQSLAMLVLSLLGIGLFAHRQFRPLIARLNELAPVVALARGTQMIAHDIRKPFSLIKMVLQNLQRPQSLEQMQAAIRKYTPEVTRVLGGVDEMLTDILELGSGDADQSQQATHEDVSIDSLIEMSLSESFKVHKCKAIRFEYRLQHSRKVRVEPRRITRVLSNLICNAIQAIEQNLAAAKDLADMREPRRLWFQTREVNRGGRTYLELAVGNSHSVIPTEDLARLFEPFFSRRKQGGTGLGLAVVDKIIREHQGEVRVLSEADVGTEFWLSLPLSRSLNQTTAVLPLTSRDLIEAQEALSEQLPRAVIGNHVLSRGMQNRFDERSALVDVLAAAVQSQGGVRQRILVIDDELVYRQNLTGLVKEHPELSALIEIATAARSDHALELLQKDDFHLIICDLDLGADSLDGFEVTRLLRREGSTVAICIHSNRCQPHDFRAAMAAGANSFLPKPMSLEHLLKLLVNATVLPEFSSHQTLADPSAVIEAETTESPLEIAVIDDDIFVRDSWQQQQEADYKIHVFSSPAVFFAAFDADTRWAKRLSLVVTDHYFEDDACTSEGVADMLASKVNQVKREQIVLIVSSNAYQLLPRHPLVSNYIDKQALAASEVRGLLRQDASQKALRRPA